MGIVGPLANMPPGIRGLKYVQRASDFGPTVAGVITVTDLNLQAWALT